MLVVDVDLPSEERHVDSGVTLARDEELVGQVLGILNVPIFKGGEGILRLKQIILLHVVSTGGGGPTDTSGTFDPEHVELLVPWVIISLELGLTIINDDGAVLLHEAEHAGAAGTAIKPNDNWVSGGGSAHRSCENVVKLLSGVNGEVARVSITGESRSVGELAHEGSGGSCDCESSECGCHN